VNGWVAVVSRGQCKRWDLVPHAFSILNLRCCCSPLMCMLECKGCTFSVMAWQPIWDAVLEFDPHLFIHLGDNIYADIKEPTKVFGKERNAGPFKNTPRFLPVTPEELKMKYDLLKYGQPSYVALRNKSQVLILFWSKPKIEDSICLTSTNMEECDFWVITIVLCRDHLGYKSQICWDQICISMYEFLMQFPFKNQWP